MCKDNCKCSKELADCIVDDYGNGIKTKFVTKEWGEQLVFAVPDEGMNMETVDVVEEIRGDISDFFIGVRENLIKNYGESSKTVVVIHDMYSKEIMEILEKYRK